MTTALDQADLALRHFDGEAALAGYEEALADGPDPQGRAGAGRVRALWLVRRWDDARRQLDALPADHLHTWLARGVVALGQPDYAAWLAVDCGSALRNDADAIAAFTAALRHDADTPEAAAGYATALRMSGQPTKAREYLHLLPRPVRESAPVQVELAMCAAELADDEVAAAHARHALELEPDRVHASLILLELARRSYENLREAIEQAADLATMYPVPDVRIMHGWMLLLAGDLRLSGDVIRNVDAWRSYPRAVRVMILDRQNYQDSAAELIVAAQGTEPASPLLRSCAAMLTIHDGSSPEHRLAAQRTILDADPRDLNARLASAHALADLDRTDEAGQIVNQLRTELPSDSQVAEAWVTLATPWSMPEEDRIPTRIVRPWESGRDDRKTVLPLLVEEVVENLQLSPDVADRLKARLNVDSGFVFRQAAFAEQHYLEMRDDHVREVARAREFKHLRLVGTALQMLANAVLGFSGGLFWWLLLPLPDLPRIGVSVVFGVAVFGYYFRPTVRTLPPGMGSFVWVLSFGSAFAGLIWQAIVWQNTGGWVLVSFAALGMVVFGVLGPILRLRFGPPTWQPQAAFDSWLESLYGNGLLPAAAEASSSPGSAFGVMLPVHCRIVSETATELDTPATRELRRLLRQRGKGSFALAGPRGAGKSTLMERWCAGHFLRADSDLQSGRQNLAVKVDAPVGYQSQEFLHHLFGQVCEAVDRYLGPSPRLKQRTHRLVLRRTVTAADPAELTAERLRRRAALERENIRYISSRTTEGELSLGVPVMGAKGKVAVQRSDVPLNHPELVGRFRDFLREVAEFVGTREGKVLIGIDELDRISSGEDAQRFINELKAVFNVPNCYFLVSVSEDALADFELAAMGMRTVFDSAFDTIVRVDYLEFTQARILLNRRIIDLPEQFAALAYVMSGGLARELARMAEEIGDDRTAENRDLHSVTTHLVQRQLSRITRAAADRLSRGDDRRAGAALIPILDEHPRGVTISADELHTYATRIEETSRANDEPALVAATRLDVAVMVRYLAMLLQIFDNNLNEERMATGRVRGLGDFETLARVRRYLGANPYGALELLNACAKAWQLSTTSAADGTVAGASPT